MRVRATIDSDRGQIGPTILRRVFCGEDAERQAREWIRKEAWDGDYVEVAVVRDEYRVSKEKKSCHR